MNNKGQTLVAFVIIVPIFILLLAFVIDTGYLLKEYTKLNSTTKTVLKNTYSKRLENNYYEKVENIFQKNNIPTANLEVITNDANEITILNRYNINSIFGKIVGLKYYEIKANMHCLKESEKLIIEKE